MTDDPKPPFILAPHVEIREATAPAPLILIVSMFPDGAEVAIPLTPDQARNIAKTMVGFADDLDAMERRN